MTKTVFPKPLLIDFDRIKLVAGDADPEIVEINEEDGFFLNDRISGDFRIRKEVYGMLLSAQKRLPENYFFMIYEAYRPLARQVALWNLAEKLLREEYPGLEGADLRAVVETYVADPYNGIGSGHQACCAVDISLCDKDGTEYDMGCACQELNDFTQTECEGLSDEVRKNRRILKDALEAEGLVNYPAEWWHFSYGDHQWAHLLGLQEAFFGPLDLDAQDERSKVILTRGIPDTEENKSVWAQPTLLCRN